MGAPVRGYQGQVAAALRHLVGAGGGAATPAFPTSGKRRLVAELKMAQTPWCANQTIPSWAGVAPRSLAGFPHRTTIRRGSWRFSP